MGAQLLVSSVSLPTPKADPRCMSQSARLSNDTQAKGTAFQATPQPGRRAFQSVSPPLARQQGGPLACPCHSLTPGLCDPLVEEPQQVAGVDGAVVVPVGEDALFVPRREIGGNILSIDLAIVIKVGPTPGGNLVLFGWP